MTSQAELINWLRDLHAMEKTMEPALKKLTRSPHTHASLREQASMHVIETQQHAGVLADCLAQLGADTSTLKATPLQSMDFTRGTGASPVSQDERIKDVLTVLVTAHFEIACHNIVRTAASQLGLLEIVDRCDPVRDEKRRMVQWLQRNLPEILSQYLSPEKDEDDEEEEENMAWWRTSASRNREQWEFVQLAPSASLFGGTLTRGGIASMPR